MTTMVTLYTGEQVPNDSEAWRLECEVRYILGLSMGERAEFFSKERAGRFRKPEALAALRAKCFELEPHYVLGLPDKPARHRYCAAVEARFGAAARADLEAKVRLLWHAQRAAVAQKESASA